MEDLVHGTDRGYVVPPACALPVSGRRWPSTRTPRFVLWADLGSRDGVYSSSQPTGLFTQHPSPDMAIDRGGFDGFRHYCGINAKVSRQQSFTPSRDGTLTPRRSPPPPAFPRGDGLLAGLVGDLARDLLHVNRAHLRDEVLERVLRQRTWLRV